MSPNTIVPVKLKDGEEIYMTLVMLDGETENTYESEEENVGIRETLNFESATSTIRSFAKQLSESLKDAAPTKMSVEFGFNFGIDSSNKIISMLVDAKVNSSVKVVLEWEQRKD